MDPGVILRVVFMIVSLGVVVGGVGGLGYALGRFMARREGPYPTLPDDHARRLRLLEDELELIQSEVAQLREEREFLRQLPSKEDRGPPPAHQDAA